MRHKTTTFIDGDQNIVIRTDIIYTAKEFLQINSEVWKYATSMEPGFLNSDNQLRLGKT
jgi:hypothetical protein